MEKETGEHPPSGSRGSAEGSPADPGGPVPDAVKRRDAILTALADVAEILLVGEGWRDRLPQIVGLLGRASGVSRAYLFRIDGDGSEERVSQVAEWASPRVEPQIDNPDLQNVDPVAAGMGRWLRELRAGRPIAGPVGSLPAAEREFLSAQEIVSVAVLPVLADRRLWGFLGFDDCEVERVWSPGELEGLRTAANLVGSALHHDEIRAARRAADERFRVLVQNVPGVVYLCEHDDRYRMLYLNDAVEEVTGYPAEEFLSDRLSFVDLYHPEDEASIHAQVDAAIAADEPFLLVYRLRHREHGWRWIEERGQAVRGPSGDVRYLGGTLVDVTDRKVVEEQLVHQALHDGLTGLPNRTLFLDRLEVAMGRSRRIRDRHYAVLFIDLDDFKLVNESWGHNAGDRLLAAIGKRLVAAVRPGDTVARFGGDEFSVLLEDLVDPSVAIRVADRIQENLRRPVRLDGREVYASASIGIAFGDATYEEPEHLLRDGDTAVYRAKAMGRGRQVVFDPAMHQRAVRRLELDAQLRRAVDEEQFAVYFQPIVDLRAGRPHAVEALVRWNHPERGVLAPDEFLGPAAEIGLIPEIGARVLRDACRQVRAWQSTSPGLGVYVNLHAEELARPRLLELVRECVEEAGLDPSLLTLEITEHVVMGEPERIVETLRRLRELGVGISIDDFGQGYSSLAYLHRFPLTDLKVDRSFVHRLDEDRQGGREILRTVRALAEALDLSVVAEGIERPEHLEAVRSLGYDRAQGFHFARPAPPDEVERLLGSARW